MNVPDKSCASIIPPCFAQAEAAGIQEAELDHAASHLGKAVGISTLLRGTVYHAQRRRVYLPADLMAQEGVGEDQLTRGEPSEGLNNVIFEVASAAKVSTDRSCSASQSYCFAGCAQD